MKASSNILLALTAVAALSVAYPAKANLITNPGFETGDYTGWTHGGGGSVVGTFNGVSPHSGSFQAFSGGADVVSQTLATMAAQSYTVNFWAAATADEGGAIFGVFLNGETVFAHMFAAGNTPYTEFTFTFTASSASTPLAFSLGPNIFLDDVSVTPTGVPDAGSTLPLLGFASLGLVALRRKLGC